MAKIYDLDVKSTLASYTLQVDLDGSTYGLAFAWNDYAGAWFLSIADADGNPLVCGVRVVVDFPLAARSTLAGMPPGMFIATDSSGAHQEPGLGDLGSRVKFQYLAVGEDG